MITLSDQAGQECQNNPATKGCVFTTKQNYLTGVFELWISTTVPYRLILMHHRDSL